MHSEHILKERSDAQNVVSRFPCGMQPFYTTRGASRAPFYKTCGKAATTPFEPSYNMFGRGRLEDLSLLDLSPLQHEHAFGIMVIGAIEDIPLNPV